jgi:acetyltransferase-like isoleucine patch superfamily enzyme
MIILVTAGGNTIDVLSWFKFKEEVIIFDDFKTGVVLDCPITGTVDDLIARYRQMIVKPKVLNCLGSSEARNRMYEKLKTAGIKTSSVVMCSYKADNVVIGNNCLINIGTQLHHDVVVGESCIISPGAIICGGVTLESNVYVGAGAIIRQGLHIGAGAIIGMGAVVLKDVPTGETWVGNPAKIIRSG